MTLETFTKLFAFWPSKVTQRICPPEGVADQVQGQTAPRPVAIGMIKKICTKKERKKKKGGGGVTGHNLGHAPSKWGGRWLSSQRQQSIWKKSKTGEKEKNKKINKITKTKAANRPSRAGRLAWLFLSTPDHPIHRIPCPGSDNVAVGCGGRPIRDWTPWAAGPSWWPAWPRWQSPQAPRQVPAAAFGRCAPPRSRPKAEPRPRGPSSPRWSRTAWPGPGGETSCGGTVTRLSYVIYIYYYILDYIVKLHLKNHVIILYEHYVNYNML